MEMDKIKKDRRYLRAFLSRAVNFFKDSIVDSACDSNLVRCKYNILVDKMHRLYELDNEFFNKFEGKDEEYEKEQFACENYRETFIECETLFDKFCKSEQLKNSEGSVASSKVTSEHTVLERNFRLPELKLPKFSGDIKEWIGFWAQFQRVDSDLNISNTDKFQYLLQCLVPGSKAYDLAKIYPISNENYTLLINDFKNRFGKDEYLIDIYIRDLINLVINSEKSKSLSKLTTSLQSSLKCLEVLGVTTDKYAFMLYPLVESSLPVEILKIWKRKKDSNTDQDQLKLLMTFLQSEVENDERIKLAKSSFVQKAKPDPTISEVQKECTAASLVSVGSSNNSCLFCSKNHLSKDCFKASDMSFEEKQKIIIKERACFKCLLKGHPAKKCRKFVRCVLCSKAHYVIMCPNKDLVGKNSSKEQEKENNEKTTTSCYSSKELSYVLLQTLLANLRIKGKEKVVRVLLDSGSQNSYIKNDLAEEFDLKESSEVVINHCLFGGNKSKIAHKLYNIPLHGLRSRKSFQFEVLGQPYICDEVPRLKDRHMVKTLYDEGVYLSDFGPDSPEIDVLLGADSLCKIMTGEMKSVAGLTCLKTELGWIAMGPVAQVNLLSINKRQTFSTLCLKNSNSIDQFWELEVLGINDPVQIQTKQEHKELVLQNFKDTVKKDSQGRYHVNLPWKEPNLKPENNLYVAEKRLRTMTDKLVKNNKFDDYDKVIKDWVNDNILEEATTKDTSCHYLPHRPVFKESSRTTKTRPVFDASCRSGNSLSLNDCLEPGPNLLELIPTVLTKFRLGKIGIAMDIKKAFLQIGVNIVDRDYLRLLWWSDSKQSSVESYRLTRVIFGVNASPFLLNATINHHLSNVTGVLKNTAEKLNSSFYVDNCLSAVQSESELKCFMEEATEIMNLGKFQLQEWAHTSGLQNFDCCDRTECLLSNGTKIVNVLGMLWDCTEDTIYNNVEAICKSTKPHVITKRSVLSMMQRIFDPLGLFSPLLIVPKTIIQECWIRKLEWDQELQKDLLDKFNNWYNNIDVLEFCKIPRVLSELKDDAKYSIHLFTDASTLAYGACIFLRVEELFKTTLRLIIAKSRISPIKKVTIPKLELMGATIGSRLLKNLMKSVNLPNCKTFCWTDSTVVLNWIQNRTLTPIFVKNRVTEILTNTESSCWNHLPGKANPADLLTRECSAVEFINSKWWEGPSWLLDKEYWPPLEQVLNETISCINTNNHEQTDSRIFTYFSSFTKNIRMIAWMLRWVKIVKEDQVNQTELSGDEIKEAERKVYKMIQDETVNLDKKLLQKLNTFVDEYGLTRVETKLVLGPYEHNFKCPVLLPYQHNMVQKLIVETHKNNSHAGVTTLICILREKFWITKCRKICRSIVRKCVICNRLQAKSVTSAPAPLPIERITTVKAFEVCGVDLAGPFYLKDNTKAWMCLYTCAVYRGVHLELLSSLSTDNFIMGLRRFIARRGRCSTIFSDQGTNFVGTSNMLKSLDWKMISDYASIQRITWKFNVASAPWWGGWFERLIRIVKGLLKRNLGTARLTFEELSTILCDCESIVNARPLTYIDENENLVPITPALFLQDIRGSETADLDLIDSKHLEKRIVYLQTLRNCLRTRFQKEYLSNLVHTVNSKKNRQLRVGEIVLIGSDNLKRIKWPLAKIIELIPGRDGNIRVVKLKTANGISTRPIQRVFPLECSEEEKEIFTNNQEKVQTVTRSGRRVQPPNRFQ